ncbi:MAG: adaptive-response sensory-kinase [Circular genetic element sp.]|nr:MAG: adaptive-response sensory-kinase [Circular genetic element sp.]
MFGPGWTSRRCRCGMPAAHKPIAHSGWVGFPYPYLPLRYAFPRWVTSVDRLPSSFQQSLATASLNRLFTNRRYATLKTFSWVFNFKFIL